MTDTTRSKPIYKRGNVVLVLFPHSDLRSEKSRPALIAQANDLQTGLPQVIVAMITSNIQRANHPSRVFFKLLSPEGKQSGLLTDSMRHDRQSGNYCRKCRRPCHRLSPDDRN